MDSWVKWYEAARKHYAPVEVTPFVYAHHVVAALEAENGEIFTGFCMEGTAGVFHLCAERAAAFNMYQLSGQTTIKRMIAFRDKPPMEAVQAWRVVPVGSFWCNYRLTTKTWKSCSTMKNAKSSL